MSRFELYKGAEKRVANMAGVMPLLAAVAERVAQEAKRLADSERIEQQIDVDAGMDAEGPVARVNANHWASWFVEGGTTTQRPKAFLRRALESKAGTVR